MWILYAFIASAGIMATEYIYNAPQFTGFWSSFAWSVVPIIVSQWALFWMFKGADNIFLAGAVFSFINIIMRTGNAIILHKPFGWITILGALVVVIGGLIIKLDK